jgi:hypothetical protein
MAIEILGSDGFIATGDDVNLFRLIALHKALKLEKIGMKLSRGRSALSIVKKEFGLKGNINTVEPLFKAIVERAKGL